jgi:hypothetical protein
MKADQSAPPSDGSPERWEPFLGVTRYERVTAMLMSLIVTVGAVTCALGAVWWTNSVRAASGTARVDSMDVDFGDDWGGVSDGGPNESWENPGEVGPTPSIGGSSDDDGGAQLQARILQLLGELPAALEMADQLIVGTTDEARGLQVGSRGTDRRPQIGDGSGHTRGVPPNRRWEIVFEKGLTIEQYAEQLDFLKVELAIVSDGRLYRVSEFASGHPAVRVVEPGSTNREICFVWRDEARRQVDLTLLRRADIPSVPDGALVMHFFTASTERRMADIEREVARARGHTTLRDVAKTRFVVRNIGGGYQLEVSEQTYLVSKVQ